MKLKILTLIFIMFFVTAYATIFLVSAINPAKPINIEATDTIATKPEINTTIPAPTNTTVKEKTSNTDATKKQEKNNSTNQTQKPAPTPTPKSKPKPKPQYTTASVAKHNTRNDCYLIINNNVYSVSSYISSHPGGTENITDVCGQEVTGIFADIHSNKAWDLLKKYKIGTISQ